jgi:twitching motility protein PilT
MQTFDQALFSHVQGGRVTRENALAAASSPQDFKLLLAAEGRVGTSMAEVLPATPDAPPAPAAPAAPAMGFATDPGAPGSPYAPVAGR